MQCERCGGLVTWRGPLSSLTHTQCEGCCGINCQVVEVNTNEDEPCQETFVGHSIMLGGWCVYSQTERAEYDVLRGPFASRDEADDALRAIGAVRVIRSTI